MALSIVATLWIMRTTSSSQTGCTPSSQFLPMSFTSLMTCLISCIMQHFAFMHASFHWVWGFSVLFVVDQTCLNFLWQLAAHSPFHFVAPCSYAEWHFCASVCWNSGLQPLGLYPGGSARAHVDRLALRESMHPFSISAHLISMSQILCLFLVQHLKINCFVVSQQKMVDYRNRLDKEEDRHIKAEVFIGREETHKELMEESPRLR